MESVTSDLELFERARSGDRGSFQELMRRYSRAIYGSLYARLRDRQAVEDLSQETYARALENVSECGDPARFGAWLLGIARNCASEYERRTTRFARRREPIFRTEADSDLLEEVLQAVQDLNDDERLVLALKYQNGLTCSQIASMTGLTLSNVKILLFRSYEALRKRVSL